MTLQIIIDYWMEKAQADLEWPKANFDSGRYSNVRDKKDEGQ